jgi:hypothetical protein
MIRIDSAIINTFFIIYSVIKIIESSIYELPFQTDTLEETPVKLSDDQWSVPFEISSSPFYKIRGWHYVCVGTCIGVVKYVHKGSQVLYFR